MFYFYFKKWVKTIFTCYLKSVLHFTIFLKIISRYHRQKDIKFFFKTKNYFQKIENYF